MKYVALLRGINVGGNKKVRMADLKKFLKREGFTNVKTLLASGNVVFDASAGSLKNIRDTIESAILKKFDFGSHTIVRPHDEIMRLVKSVPFKGITVTAQTRLYVTFLSKKPTKTLKLPASYGNGIFRILKATEGEVCSVLIVTEGRRSVDLMEAIEKEYGKDVTTRNWNTVQKIAST